MLKFDLHKKFVSKNRTTEIQCQAEIPVGTSTAIYGKSGVGKSSILRMIAGLDTSDSGTIFFNQECWFDQKKEVNLPIRKRGIGFVFQDFNLFPNMTVERNLKYASGFGISAEILDLLEATRLTKLMKSYPQDLSGGEKQRIAIIRALCQQPQLLLLDEPFSALDDDSIEEIIGEIKLIQERIVTTVILVSHRKDVIHAMASLVVKMESGKAAVQGVPKQLLGGSF